MTQTPASSDDLVEIRHEGVDGTLTKKRSQLAGYEKRGWVLVDSNTPEASTPPAPEQPLGEVDEPAGDNAGEIVGDQAEPETEESKPKRSRRPKEME